MLNEEVGMELRRNKYTSIIEKRVQIKRAPGGLSHTRGEGKGDGEGGRGNKELVYTIARTRINMGRIIVFRFHPA